MRRRIFLVATGSSLNITPLDMLKKEDTFSLNRINLIYPLTSWRPTYFLYAEPNTANEKSWKNYIEPNLASKHLWLPEEYKRDGLDNVTWTRKCPLHSGYSGGNPRSIDKWHFPDVCHSLNSISAMIQISVQMGYKKIYLLGCDLGYKLPYQSNHFDPNYDAGHEPQDIGVACYWVSADEYNATRAHQVAKRECDERGVKIYNATYGGKLEIYERKDLLNVLKSRRIQ